jgi:hypothetical protein
MVKTIGNPLSWTANAFGRSSHQIGDSAAELGGAESGPIEIRDQSWRIFSLEIRLPSRAATSNRKPWNENT